MLAEVKSVLLRAEGERELSGALRVLRELPLDDFGSFLFSLPQDDFPNLSGLLPRMADVEVQEQWTGSSGHTLLSQTTPFIRSVAYNYSKYCKGTLDNLAALDFGCGYGRLARMLYYFTDDYTGVDPWQRSIDICNNDRLLGKIALSEYLPSDLPVTEPVDFAIAFSVFTHTSAEATRTGLSALRKHVKPGGMLALTIRPVEYWRYDTRYADLKSELKREHNSTGFAYRAHQMTEHYGDTSMTLEYLQSVAEGWKILGIDRTHIDYYQTYVFLG